MHEYVLHTQTSESVSEWMNEWGMRYFIVCVKNMLIFSAAVHCIWSIFVYPFNDSISIVALETCDNLDNSEMTVAPQYNNNKKHSKLVIRHRFFLISVSEYAEKHIELLRANLNCRSNLINFQWNLLNKNIFSSFIGCAYTLVWNGRRKKFS